MPNSWYELSSFVNPHPQSPPHHEHEHQVDLAEDVLLEIFLRLPLKSICKFRCVSKSCLSLFSNPSFINKFVMRSCDGNTPWTLVNQHSFDFMEEPFDDAIHKAWFCLTVSTELHHKAISSQPGFSFDFVLDSCLPKQEPRGVRPFFLVEKQELCSNSIGIEISGVYPLASSNGLILCSSKEDYGRRDYFICNPFTRQFVSLPQPTPNIKTKGLNGFVYESETYKVIHISDSCVSRRFNIQIFSSNTNDWSTHEVTCSQEMHINNYKDHRPFYHCFRPTAHLHIINYHSGLWYWIDGRGDRMITYNHNNGDGSGGECRLFDLPEESNRVNLPQQCIGESKGLLCYGQIDNKSGGASTISVWVFQDGYSTNGRSTWQLVCKDTKIEDSLYVIPTRRRNKHYSFIGFNPVDPNVVIMDCHHENQHHVCEVAYNVKTRKYEILRPSQTLLDWYYYIPDTRFAVTLQPTIIPTVTS